MCAAIVLLGAADVMLTAWGLSLGVIEEANPLLSAGLVAIGSWTWLLAWGIPALCVVVLWSLRRRSGMVLPALRGLLVVRVLVIGLHLHWIAAVWG